MHLARVDPDIATIATIATLRAGCRRFGLPPVPRERMHISYDCQSRLFKLNGHGGSSAGAGRPTGSINKTTADVRALAAAYGADAIAELARLAGITDAPGAQTETARITALGMLLDRGYGRVTLPLTSDPDRPISIEF